MQGQQKGFSWQSWGIPKVKDKAADTSGHSGPDISAKVAAQYQLHDTHLPPKEWKTPGCFQQGLKHSRVNIKYFLGRVDAELGSSDSFAAWWKANQQDLWVQGCRQARHWAALLGSSSFKHHMWGAHTVYYPYSSPEINPPWASGEEKKAAKTDRRIA